MYYIETNLNVGDGSSLVTRPWEAAMNEGTTAPAHGASIGRVLLLGSDS
jgi:hypothetical protein